MELKINLNSKSGFSVIEVIMAAGLMMLIAGSVTSMMITQNKSIKQMSQKIAMNDMKNGMITSMQDISACAVNLSSVVNPGLTFDSTAASKSLSVNKIRISQDPTSASLIEVGAEISPGSGLIVSNILLDQITDVGLGKWTGVWKISFINTASGFVFKPITLNPQKFDVDVTDPTAAIITACHAVTGSGGGTSSWITGALVAGSTTINYAGNVGIGTTLPGVSTAATVAAPNRALDISGDGTASSNAYGTLILSNNRASASTGDGTGTIHFTSNDNDGNSPPASIVSNLTGMGGPQGFGGDLSFWTKSDNVNNALERVRINNVGNVGIGTTAPTGKLTVAGGDIVVETGAVQSNRTTVGPIFTNNATNAQSALTGVGYPSSDVFTLGYRNDGKIAMGVFHENSGLFSGYHHLGSYSAFFGSSYDLNDPMGVANGGAGLYTYNGWSALYSYGIQSTRFEYPSVDQQAFGIHVPSIVVRRNRGTALAPTRLNVGDELGNLAFASYSGPSGIGAKISSFRDTGTNPGEIPARLGFFTTNEGASLTEKMSVLGNGNVGIGTTLPQTTLQVAGVISPATNNTYTLGNATYRFTEVYATNGVINTSDRWEKKDIYNTDLGLDFINKLRPVSYRWKTGVDNDVHYGLIAQEVEQVIAEAGKTEKTSIVTHDETTDRYGVRYSELFSPLIKAVQELYDKFLGVDREIVSINVTSYKVKKRQYNEAYYWSSLSVHEVPA